MSKFTKKTKIVKLRKKNPKTKKNLIKNIDSFVDKCNRLSFDLENKHNELIDMSKSFKNSVNIIKKLNKYYNQLVLNIFNILNTDTLNEKELRTLNNIQNDLKSKIRVLEKKIKFQIKKYNEIDTNH